MSEPESEMLKPVKCVVTSDPIRYPELHFTKFMRFDRVPMCGESVELHIPTLGDTALVKVFSVVHRENKETLVFIEF